MKVKGSCNSKRNSKTHLIIALSGCNLPAHLDKRTTPLHGPSIRIYLTFNTCLRYHLRIVFHLLYDTEHICLNLCRYSHSFAILVLALL